MFERPKVLRLNRRQFLAVTVVTGVGAGLAWQWGDGRGRLRRWLSKPASEVHSDAYFNAFLRIDADNRFHFVLDKTEMGQGVISSLGVIIAEELNLEPALLQIEFTALGAAQRNHLYKPSWGTGGSTSVQTLWRPLREAGALTRDLFRQAAADLWALDVDACVLENGVVSAGERSARCSELLPQVAKTPLPALTLKSPADFRWVGKTTARVDTRDKVMGTARYGNDHLPSGCPVAAVVRTRRRPLPADVHAALARQPGVLAVIPVPEGLAVVAENSWRALQARDWAHARRAEPEPDPQLDGDAVRQRLLARLDQSDWSLMRARGSVLPEVVRARYYVPFIAQLPMEPLNCTVVIDDGHWTVWTSTQRPVQALGVVRRVSGLPAERVSLRTAYAGGGLGRRLQVDFIEEAALIARDFGASVQLLWTRDDELAQGFFRPAVAAEMALALNEDGQLSLHQRNASVEHSPLSRLDWQGRLGYRTRLWRGKLGLDHQTVLGVADPPYALAAQQLETAYLGLPVQTGFWRSTGHSFNAFFIESALDELAHARGEDPVDLRLRLLRDQPRLHAALTRVAAHARTQREPGESLGFASHLCYGSAIALAVALRMEQGKVKVTRVSAAIDCGVAVDPEGVRAQVEGGVVYGLCAALHGELRFQGGVPAASGFGDYPVMRLSEAPAAIDVMIMPSDAAPAGVGETATSIIAPALCNALFAATGQRHRQLPVYRAGTGAIKVV